MNLGSTACKKKLACWLQILIMVVIVTCTSQISWSSINLPDEHLPYFFHDNPSIREACRDDDSCPYKNAAEENKCWGHEDGCSRKTGIQTIQCPEDCIKGWAKTKEEQMETFWRTADFGYVKARKEEMTTLCSSQQQGDSELRCVKYTRYCYGKNVYMDFSDLNIQASQDRFREDVFRVDQIGGHCKMDKKLLKSMGEHKSPLQSWFAELENFSSLKFQPITDKKCDIVIDKPVIMMKLDAGVNMFHHFCDFVNLYASQHLNNSFSLDVQIIMWDTSPYNYGDFFSVTWKAFSKYPVIFLRDYEGKKVCFKEVMFSLLPRMRYGLYYNMPLIPGCHGSGLMRAFSQHVLHRLNRTQEGPLERQIRITLLARGSKYRNIMNQAEIAGALKTRGDIQFKVVQYNHEIPFLEQLQITHNSDLFIGMHGAGLTHLLFLPDWAVIFELYNCEDKDCYYDLARLRGVHYITWEKQDKLTQEDEGHHPTLGAHAKFTNYAFDVKELMRLIDRAVDHVRNHPAFLAAWQARYSKMKDEL